MTLKRINEEISKVKKLSRRQMFRYLSDLHIKPLGTSKPRNYPDDTAAKIINRLGWGGRIPSVTELLAERSKAKRRAA